MSVLRFAMGFTMTEAEQARTEAVTNIAYGAWVLVNDYFSWEKELVNYRANGSEGKVANAVFLFMEWYSVDDKEAKKMVKAEIEDREERYLRAKEDLLTRGQQSEKTKIWLNLLDLVTAGVCS